MPAISRTFVPMPGLSRTFVLVLISHLSSFMCDLHHLPAAYLSSDAAPKVTSSSRAHIPMLLVPEPALAQPLRCIHIHYYRIQPQFPPLAPHTRCTFLVHGTTTSYVVTAVLRRAARRHSSQDEGNLPGSEPAGVALAPGFGFFRKNRRTEARKAPLTPRRLLSGVVPEKARTLPPIRPTNTKSKT